MNTNEKQTDSSTEQKPMKLTAHERIHLLADDASFLELGKSAHSSVPEMEERTPADGLIGGGFHLPL